jgi:hypothetical protein
MAHLITSADLEGLDLALHAIEDAYKYKLTIVPSGESGIDIMPPEGEYDKGDVTISMTSLKEHKSDVMDMRRTLSEAQYALSKEYYHVTHLLDIWDRLERVYRKIHPKDEQCIREGGCLAEALVVCTACERKGRYGGE